ncbi:MAG: peptidase [Comamonadaceae bacterium PBBC2]|nr:MAG: peptidase [Comamonadaceae bacterium PBBC2]
MPAHLRFPLSALVLASCAGLTPLAQAAGPTAVPAASALRAPGPAFPVYASPQALQQACDQGLQQAGTALKQLEKLKPGPRWLAAQDRFDAQVQDLSNPITFVSAVHPDKAMRDASEACELRWNDFGSTLGQNERLYRAVKAVKPADAIDALLRQRLIDEFDDAGVGLPPAQRAQAKQLSDRINELTQTFDRRIRDANVKLAFTEAELAGVPEAVWKTAPRDDQGRVVLGLSYPQYVPVMDKAENAATRERMWRAKQSEGGEANLQLLGQIVELRRQYAALFGAKSWAEFQLRRRMAKTPERAEQFLADVKQAVAAREVKDIDELRQAKAEHLGQPLAQVTLARWDYSFYTERVRNARYQVDQEAFRPYFPPQQSLAFALRLVERLMGVRYQRVDGVAAWHPEVQTYAVSDAATGKALATLYVDLYPREGKYNHAAVWGLRGASTATGQPGQAALVVNFDRNGLSLEELETLLHELGHAVHNNLSATRYSQQAGTRVKRDFVEAPSQMLEDWVYDAGTLKLFAEVCPKPMALWAQMEGATPLGHVKGTMFPAGFSHIAGGYSAGYYGYLWSLVVATDLRTAFDGHRLDPAVGKRYRDLVIGQGGQQEPDALVRHFLGRDFNAKAFYQELAK